MAASDGEELPRITLSMLRRADTMCPRRLAHEHSTHRKPSPLSDAAFEVPNRLVEDAITWHKGGVASDNERIAFPPPRDLAPEQQALYTALARGYLTTFPAVDVSIGELPFATDIAELGVRLVGPVGIPVEHASGAFELRVLRVAKRDPLLDDTDIRFTILRVREWAHASVRLVAFDPLELRSVEYDLDVPAHLDESIAWLAQRIAVVTARADRQRTIAGADCRDCSCIPGCPQITRAS